MPTQFDGKTFRLEAIDPSRPGLFFLILDDGSAPPMAVRSSFHGSRYDGDPFDNGPLADGATRDPRAGKDENYVPMAFVGAEMLELRAKLGGAPVGVDNWPAEVPVATHDDGSPWTPAECAAFRGPIHGGPNAGPDINNAKSLDELAKEAGETSAPSAPVSSTPPAPAAPPVTPIPPAGPPLASSTNTAVAHHADSFLGRVEDALNNAGHAAGSEAHHLYLEARDAIAALLERL